MDDDIRTTAEASESMSDRQLLTFVFNPGFSTAAKVTD